MTLDLALRTTLILVAAWATTVALRRAAAATRHLVLHAAVVAVLLAPLLAPIAPSFGVPAVPVSLRISAATSAPASDRSNIVLPRSTPDYSNTDAVADAPAEVAPPIERIIDHLDLWLPIVWIVGTVVCALYFAIGWFAAMRAARRAVRADPAWETELNDLRQKLRINREVRLALVSEQASPVVTGLFAPSVLLPVRAREWDAARRRAVLLHELAHVQRGDCRVQALAQAACALYWFNPLMWSTFARLRAERERACDDRVLMSGLTPSTYAGHLLEIARDLRNGLRPSAALAMARPSEIEGRLLAVLAERRNRTPSIRARITAIAMVAVATAAALGASPTPGTAPENPAGTTPVAGRFFVPLDGLAPEQRPAERAARSEATRTLQGSTDWRERERAVLDLVGSEDEPPIAPLAAALDDPSRDVREKAALGLALRSGADVVPALLKALHDSDSQVREKAALGLALRRDTRATEALLAATADPDAQVREKVAMALATSGDARAEAALKRLFTDPDSHVREKAVNGLTLLEQGAGASPEAESIRRGLRGLVGAIARLTR